MLSCRADSYILMAAPSETYKRPSTAVLAFASTASVAPGLLQHHCILLIVHAQICSPISSIKLCIMLSARHLAFEVCT